MLNPLPSRRRSNVSKEIIEPRVHVDTASESQGTSRSFQITPRQSERFSRRRLLNHHVAPYGAKIISIGK